MKQVTFNRNYKCRSYMNNTVISSVNGLILDEASLIKKRMMKHCLVLIVHSLFLSTVLH